MIILFNESYKTLASNYKLSYSGSIVRQTLSRDKTYEKQESDD